MGPGPIPWTATHAYAAHKGLDATNTDLLWRIVRTMDEAFRKWHADEAEKRRKKP